MAVHKARPWLFGWRSLEWRCSATALGKTMRVLERLRSISVIKPEQWDHHKYLRAALVLSMIVCTLASGVGWYDLARGQAVRLSSLLLFTVGGAAILFVVPRRLQLITQVFAGFLAFSAMGTILGRAPLVLGLELIAASGVLLVFCSFLKVRRERRQNSTPDGGRSQ